MARAEVLVFKVPDILIIEGRFFNSSDFGKIVQKIVLFGALRTHPAGFGASTTHPTGFFELFQATGRAGLSPEVGAREGIARQMVHQGSSGVRPAPT